VLHQHKNERSIGNGFCWQWPDNKTRNILILIVAFMKGSVARLLFTFCQICPMMNWISRA